MGKKATPDGGPRAKKRKAINVFIGWSGEECKAFANELAEWLELFFLASQINVFMSDRNIATGRRWFDQLIPELRTTHFGILCWTHANVHSEWLLFEAGALAISSGEAEAKSWQSGPINLLLGIKEVELADPLKHFQYCPANKVGGRRLIGELNARMIALKLDGHEEKKLDTLFETMWQKLSVAIDRLAKRRLLPITKSEFANSELSASSVLAYNFTLNCEVGEYDPSKGMSSGDGYLGRAVSDNLARNKPYHYIFAQPEHDDDEEWIDELTKQIAQFVDTLATQGLQDRANLAEITVMSARAPIELLSLDIHRLDTGVVRAYWWIESDSAGNVHGPKTEIGWLSSEPEKMQELWIALVDAAAMFGQKMSLLEAAQSPDQVKREFHRGRKYYHEIVGTNSSDTELRSRFKKLKRQIRQLERELWHSVAPPEI